jgi:hypothetical protein
LFVCFQGKAKASVAPGVCEKLLGFEDLRGASIPLCFYGVAGKDEVRHHYDCVLTMMFCVANAMFDVLNGMFELRVFI